MEKPDSGGLKTCVIIGLTGGSGSGKSSAAAILAGLGARVIDADKIAHEVSERRDVLDELKESFGDWIIGENGSFNRALASKRAFSDTDFLGRLTGITHKYIINEIYARVGDIKRELTADNTAGSAVIVIDAPLPVEKGFLDLADEVWVIRASRGVRRDRVIERDNIGADAVEARFSSQLPDAGYEKLADALIDNDGTPEDLERVLTAEFRRAEKNIRRF